MLENGLDFVRSSLDHLTAAQAARDNQNQKRYLKYALIHLCSGIGLVLKERLKQEGWQLLFQDLNKAAEKTYESGDFKSVDFLTLQERLENESLVQFTSAQKAELKSFRSRRNRVEHFNVGIGDDEVGWEIADIEGVADALFIRSSVVAAAHGTRLNHGKAFHILASHFHKICSVNAAFTRYSTVISFIVTEEQSSSEESGQ